MAYKRLHPTRTSALSKALGKSSVKSVRGSTEGGQQGWCPTSLSQDAKFPMSRDRHQTCCGYRALACGLFGSSRCLRLSYAQRPISLELQSLMSIPRRGSVVPYV